MLSFGSVRYLRRGNGTKPLWVSRLAYISLSHVLHEACVVSRANPKGLSSSTSVIAKAKLGILEIPPASRTSTKRHTTTHYFYQTFHHGIFFLHFLLS